jgi:thiol-disulfide isomerase/thioredoxin
MWIANSPHARPLPAQAFRLDSSSGQVQIHLVHKKNNHAKLGKENIMRISRLYRALALPAVLAMAAATSFAATLNIGDPAPPLQVAKWVQGDPVPGFDSNHVYIVEFWATWCGPCKASIPHLNETWQKFKDKDVIVIGQDCWEPNDDGVPAFIQKMGDKMTYRVALDDKSQSKDGAMAVTWMKAAGQHGIPTAFVVNRAGQIAWIGHPMTLEESVLEQILADKFDVAAFATKFERQQQEQEQQQALSRKLQTALRDKNWDTAEAAVTDMEKSMPEDARFRLSPTRLQILLGRPDYAAAYKLVQSESDAHPVVELQNSFAWTLATTKGVDAAGLALAQKIAERANTASHEKDPQILDTLARLQFMNGQTTQATATEQKAVDLAPDEMKSSLQKTLADYQAGKLPDVKE